MDFHLGIQATLEEERELVPDLKESENLQITEEVVSSGIKLFNEVEQLSEKLKIKPGGNFTKQQTIAIKTYIDSRKTRIEMATSPKDGNPDENMSDDSNSDPQQSSGGSAPGSPKRSKLDFPLQMFELTPNVNLSASDFLGSTMDVSMPPQGELSNDMVEFLKIPFNPDYHGSLSLIANSRENNQDVRIDYVVPTIKQINELELDKDKVLDLMLGLNKSLQDSVYITNVKMMKMGQMFNEMKEEAHNQQLNHQLEIKELTDKFNATVISLEKQYDKLSHLANAKSIAATRRADMETAKVQTMKKQAERMAEKAVNLGAGKTVVRPSINPNPMISVKRNLNLTKTITVLPGPSTSTNATSDIDMDKLQERVDAATKAFKARGGGMGLYSLKRNVGDPMALDKVLKEYGF